MNEKNYKKLNPTQTIQKSFPAIIEAFVTFYGESERQNIETKFKNMLVIGYSSPEEIKRILNDDNKKKSTELIEKFIIDIGIDQTEKEKMRKIFFGNYNLDDWAYTPINNYIGYINGAEYQKTNAIKFLQQLYPEVTNDNLDNLIASGTLNDLDKYIKAFTEILMEYKKYKESIEQYRNYLAKCDELKHNLEMKYLKKFISTVQDLFTETELSEFEQIFNNKHFSYYSLYSANKKTKNLLGFSFNSPSLIEAFSTENEILLDNGVSWQKSSIIRDKISYFKNFGLNLGDDYELYKNNPQTKQLIPSQELIERVINTRTTLYTEMKNEYYQSLPEFKDNRKRIDNEQLLDKEDSYDANAYENNKTFVAPNIKSTENGYIIFPLMCISMGGVNEYLDHNIIHELNHVFELHLSNVEWDFYSVTCGWDLLKGQISNQRSEVVSIENNQQKREYELMNEIINELISQEITNILFQSEHYIFNTKEDAKIKGGTSYELTRFLIIDFYEIYKKEIIESRKSGDITKLYETVGKENLEELNNLFHIFYKHFPGIGLKFYDAISAKNEGRETEETKILDELIAKRDEILNRMEAYNKKQMTL